MTALDSLIPIYVMAENHRHAEHFVRQDLCTDPRRLRWVDRPDHLRGLRGGLLYILPAAHHHPNYYEMLTVAKHQGFILLRVDDDYARQRYYREREKPGGDVKPARPKLTPQQMAERRLGRANVVNTVACPVCLAVVGQQCFATHSPFRLSPHRERIAAASIFNRSHPARPGAEILPAEGTPPET